MKNTQTFYAVQLAGSVTPRPHLALGCQAGPALYYWRRDAVKFKRGLVGEGFKKAKVVRVLVSHTW